MSEVSAHQAPRVPRPTQLCPHVHVLATFPHHSMPLPARACATLTAVTGLLQGREGRPTSLMPGFETHFGARSGRRADTDALCSCWGCGRVLLRPPRAQGPRRRQLSDPLRTGGVAAPLPLPGRGSQQQGRRLRRTQKRPHSPAPSPTVSTLSDGQEDCHVSSAGVPRLHGQAQAAPSQESRI